MTCKHKEAAITCLVVDAQLLAECQMSFNLPVARPVSLLSVLVGEFILLILRLGRKETFPRAVVTATRRPLRLRRFGAYETDKININ